jgi:hypothetical protein
MKLLMEVMGKFESKRIKGKTKSSAIGLEGGLVSGGGRTDHFV